MDPLDDTVRAAMRALEEGVTPRDYFDRLPDRIHVRLEGSMQTEPETTRSPDGSRNDANGVPRQEDSGLHDIKALAQTTRNRIHRRQTSQHDLDETLLAASSSGLHAVALPDPAKMVQLPTVDEARALARTSAGMAAVAVDEVEAAPARAAIAAPAPRKGVPVWVWAGGGLAAAAAVVGFVVLGGKGGDGDDAAKQEPPAVAQGESQPASKAAAPALDEGITTGGLAEDPPAADPAPMEAAAVQPEPEEEAAKPDDAVAPAKKETGKDRRDRADDTKVDAKKDTAKPDVKKGDDLKDKKQDKDKDEKKAPPPVDKKLEGAVLGAGDEDILGIGDALGGGGKKKDEAPKKTELTTEELREGLDAINGKAKACYGAHGQTGTVKVKLTVSPSGKVSKASATGDLAGTPSGDCVVSAVKSASFPAWDGAPKSTIYVVLLSD